MTNKTLADPSVRTSRRRPLSTIGAVLLLVLSFLGSTPATAGGDYFKAEVLDFQALGNDEYRIVLRQMTGLYGDDRVPTEPLVIHLRHNESAMRRQLRDSVSEEQYLSAIELLKQQISESKVIHFGVMGGGLAPIEGKPGEFQGNSLSIEEPPFPDPAIERVVFSWYGSL